MHCHKCGSTEQLRQKSKFSSICRSCTNEEAARYRANKVRPDSIFTPENMEAWIKLADASHKRVLEMRT